MFEFFGLLRCLEGAGPVELSLFLLIGLLFAPLLALSFVLLLCAGFRWAGYFCFEIGSRCLAAILFGLIWCFSSVPGVRGVLLVLKSGGPIAFDSRTGVSYLAQVWFWALYGFFQWTGGREVVEVD